MRATVDRGARWEQRDYQTITDIAYDGQLTVRFADGDVATVDAGRLVPSSAALDWSRGDHSEHEILVPTRDGETLAISWMDVRAQSDREFAEYLIETADEEARQIGRRLRTLREQRGMTSKAVAEAAGIAPLSLSRIELGRHDVVYRTMSRILAAMHYSLRDLAEASEPSLSVKEVVSRLRSAKVPVSVIDQLRRASTDQSEKLTLAIERIFRWSPEQLAAPGTLSLSPAAAAIGRFKTQVNQDPALAAYTLWAHWLAMLVDQAVPRPSVEIPENPAAIREEILERHVQLRFAQLLDWCWEHNIAVLPLQDPGHFHGAVWSFEGRVVVVLKQLTPWSSRWTFDLGHETGHIARHLGAQRTSIVELADINPFSPMNDDDEQEANDFAGELLLENADKLARELAERSLHRLPRLKRAVQEAANEHGMDAGALANYMAWRLELEGEDWWSTAAKLQDKSEDAPTLTRQALETRIDWSRLDEDDAALLQAALEWGDES